LKDGASLLLATAVKDEELESKLPSDFRETIAYKKAKLYLLHVPPDAEISPETEAVILELAFLRISGQDASIPALCEKLANSNDNQTRQSIQKVTQEIEKYIRRFEVPESWSEADISSRLPSSIEVNSFC